MKVTGNRPPGASELTSQKAREAEQQQSRRRPQGEQDAARARHTAALTTHKLREAVRNTPDVRADRVADVKERLQAGRLEINAERIAEKLLVESLRDDVEKP